MPRPCIVIPGIQGSGIQNFYPISPATTWSTAVVAETSILAPNFDALALADDAQSDRSPEVVNRAYDLLEIAYAPLVSGLQGRLDCPTYLFPYDWRYSNADSAGALVSFVERLRLKMLPLLPGWQHDFDFVCHSMGGLIFRAFLAEWLKRNPGKSPPVGRVVFIATPHRGSLHAAQALISGEGGLFGGRKAMRKLARTFPSVYELLPLPRNGVMWAERNGQEIDLFVEANWQNTATQPDVRNSGYDVQQTHLDAAKQFLQSLPMPTDPPFGIPASDILVIYGAKPNSTMEAVAVGPPPDQWYDFDNARLGTGDDVVPVGSAKLQGIASVAIQPEDINYFLHPVQRAYAELDLHPFLPAIDEVQTIASEFLQGNTGETILPKSLQGKNPSRFAPS